MSKNSKSELRNSFRPALQVKSINQLKKENPNFHYKLVRYDDALNPDGDRLDRYLDKGWEIVSSTDTLDDDRSTAPKSKEEDTLRPKPMTKSGKGGAQFVVMRVTKDQFTQNQQERVNRDLDRLAAKTKVKRSGNNIHITDTEINENNVEE